MLGCVLLFLLTACDISQTKLSTMESDCTTLNMMIKEAIITYKCGNKTKTYNGRTADSATVGDVCEENGVSSDSEFFKRTIGGSTYTFVFSDEDVKISGGDYNNTGETITADSTIASLAGKRPLSALVIGKWKVVTIGNSDIGYSMDITPEDDFYSSFDFKSYNTVVQEMTGKGEVSGTYEIVDTDTDSLVKIYFYDTLWYAGKYDEEKERLYLVNVDRDTGDLGKIITSLEKE